MSETILLVEDDENDVFFLQHAMKRAGMLNPLQVASDGQRAIHYLQGTGEYNDRTRFPLPSLVLLDLKLPFIMGLDVLKWIREQPQFDSVIVLVLTSSKFPNDITKANRLGANSYLIKPSSPAELIEMVRMIQQHWLAVSQALSAPTEVVRSVEA